MTDSLAVRTAFNPGGYPVVDRKGQALTRGARVRFRLPSHYINTFGGEGVVDRLDQYGGAYIYCRREKV